MVKAINNYNKITTSKDLRRNKITKAEYDMIFYLLRDMANGEVVATMFENVAMWFKRNGCKVKEITCGWQILY